MQLINTIITTFDPNDAIPDFAKLLITVDHGNGTTTQFAITTAEFGGEALYPASVANLMNDKAIQVNGQPVLFQALGPYVIATGVVIDGGRLFDPTGSAIVDSNDVNVGWSPIGEAITVLEGNWNTDQVIVDGARVGYTQDAVVANALATAVANTAAETTVSARRGYMTDGAALAAATALALLTRRYN